MKAWQFVGQGKPLVRTEIPEPVAGPGEVVVEIKAAGVCHTDVSIMEGPVSSILAHIPIVLGHEVAGVIAEIGPDVNGFAVGDAVGIDPSEGLTGPGVGRDGGYAEKAIAKVGELVRIPAGVSFEQAAAGTDAGATAYHAVRTAGKVEAGTKVVIIGLGGLGQIGARVAVLAGAEVYVADIRPELAEVAAELGAVKFVTDVSELTSENADVVVDFAGANTTQSAIAVVRPGGRVVQIGAAAPEATISVFELMMKRVELVGSLGSDRGDLEEVYRLFSTGQLNPVISTIGFEEIAEGLERLRKGDIAGRLVAQYSA
jgi:propanol-preferring alcohol dehydrogenase